MSVLRIVPNLATPDVERARAFYGDLLGMAIAMDHGWIVTFVGQGRAAPQISFATEGGSGTPVPDLSIEVDDLDAIHERMAAAGYGTAYGPVNEPWGVRRFFVRDPFGRLLNILSHGTP
ncbi:VOC family protein [Luteibacter sp. PPL201]|uniref:VOC family protein n=1 Tax=Luteibacter sahnii TaxID=3021977 RepID=A0ABT6BCA3_9GAMM|nr:VOC family protein [Luteibacter sp. PPL193]MDY1547683.1 VOC family protein [Luteibacter sp. PPL193]